MQPVEFDWKTSHADRFVNSPCYKQIGFDPNVAYDSQDKNILNVNFITKQMRLGTMD